MLKIVAKYVLEGIHSREVQLEEVRKDGCELEVSYRIPLSENRLTKLHHETINIWEAIGEIIVRSENSKNNIDH